MVNRDGTQSGDNTLHPTCWDPEGIRTILPVMMRVGELIAQEKSAAEIKRDIDEGFARIEKFIQVAKIANKCSSVFLAELGGLACNQCPNRACSAID